MQRYSEWYFQDWKEEQRVFPGGKKKRIYTYVGDYYQLPEKAGTFKGFHSVVFLLFVIGLLYLNACPSPGGLTRQVGPLCLLSCAPAIYWGIGLLSLLPASGQMTYRRYRRSIVRMRWASGLAAAVLALALLFELRFVAVNGTALPELCYLSALLLVLAAAGAATALLLRFPCRPVGPQGT